MQRVITGDVGCKQVGHNSRICKPNKIFVGYNVIYLRYGLLFQKINRMVCFLF
ncbi:hypothetical protein V1527DRAFT_468531 [Lipomyces starkeyi]